MAIVIYWQCTCLYLISALFFCRAGSTFSWYPRKDPHSSTELLSVYPELDTALTQIAHPVPEVHRKVREYVKRLEIAPTCTRRAAYGLLMNCANFSSTQQGLRHLENIKAMYAARLAVCELYDAGLSAPLECDLGALEDSGQDRSGLRASSDARVNKCIKALESRPQSWTSYSNNRQNALLICQASRAEAEREEMLSLFTKLAQNNEDSEQRLAESLQFSDERLREQRATVSKLQKDVLAFSQDINNEIEDSREIVSSFGGRVEIFGSDLARNLASISRQTTDEVQQLMNVLKHANSEAFSSVSNLVRVSNEAVLQNKEDLQASAELTFSLRQGFNMLHQQQSKLDQQMEHLHQAIQLTSEQHDQTAMAILQKSQSTLAQLIDMEDSTSNMVDALDKLLSFGHIFSNLRRHLSSFLLVTSLLILPRVIIGTGGWRLSIILGGAMLAFIWLSSPYVTSQLLTSHTDFFIVNPIIIALPIVAFSLGFIFCLVGRLAIERLPRVTRCQRASASNHQMPPQKPLIFQYYDPDTEDFADILLQSDKIP